MPPHLIWFLAGHSSTDYRTHDTCKCDSSHPLRGSLGRLVGPSLG